MPRRAPQEAVARPPTPDEWTVLIGFAALLWRRMYRRILRARSATDVKTPRASTSRSTFKNHSSTWFSHDEYVGVKCSRTFAWFRRKVRTACVLWVDRLSAIT